MAIQDGRLVRNQNFTRDRDARNPRVPISAVKFDDEFQNLVGAINGIIDGTIPIAAGGGAMLAEVFAAIRDDSGAIVDGARVQVDRSVPNVLTIRIVAAADLAYPRYWLWTNSMATPSAAQFLAGTVSMSEEVRLPVSGGSMYLWVADQSNDIGVIQQENQENWRDFFTADGVALMISGVQYYAYGLSFEIDEETVTNWEIHAR